MEPLRGTVNPLFFTFLAGHRSSLRAYAPRFSDAPFGLIPPDNRCTPALPLAIDFSRQKAKKIVGGEEVIAMSDPKNTLEQVGGYEVPVDPMADLECDSCQ